MREVENGRGFVGSILVFLCGLLMLELGGFANASATEVKITSPTYDSVVKGMVPIDVWMHAGCSWANIYIDGNYLASTPGPISWLSTDVSNGTHRISAKVYNTSSVLLGTTSKLVRVKNSATPTATHTATPTSTPTPTGSVTFTSPANGATVSGTVSIAVQTSSPVSWVNFYIDGSWVASSPPFTLSWNSTSVANGVHTVAVNGYNSSNALVASASISLNVKNGSPTPTPTPTIAPTPPPPTPTPTPTPVGSVTFTSPANGATVSGTVSIAVQTSAPVSWVNFYIDGVWLASSPPFSTSWNSTSVANGIHTVAVNGYNSSNVLVASASISLNVKNGSPTPTPTITTTPPPPTPTSTPTPVGSVTFTSPANGATVSGTVSIAVQTSAPVSWVNFYIDGVWLASSPPFSTSWNSTSVANGIHTVAVNGYNSSNVLVASASISLNVKNGSPTPTPTITPTSPPPTPTPTPTPAGGVTITSPTSGATVSGTVSIVVQTVAPVSWVNFYIDGTWVASSPPFTMSWNSTSVANGTHTIAVNGYSSTNTLMATTAMNVNVQNGGAPTPTPTSTVKPTPTPSSTATPYYSLVPTGTTLPSDSQCASGAAGDTFEPRPVNAVPNSTMPTSSDMTTFRSNASGGEGGAPGSYLIRADGQFTGTTDAILKWASCKWGFDENVTRATAVNETHWRQLELGDIGNGTSIGILQIKSRDYPSTCESVASSQNTADVTNEDCYSYKSTAFAADYKLAQQRACFEGQISYMIGESPAGYPSYPNGTPDQMMWGCVGWWFSGHWYDSGAVNYISQVQGYLAAETWLQAGF